MDIAPLPASEAERLAALRSYAVLDTPPEQSFDELTEFASALCETPIALISLVDSERQWFKSRVGLDAPETPRDIAFCTHAILQRQVFEVDDAARDPRFADNPLVVGDPNIRFYAGAPLIDPGGHALGTLCVIDRVPRHLTEVQRKGLQVLGRAVIQQIELRHWVRELSRFGLELAGARDQALAGTRAKDIFLAGVSHELRTPLNSMLGLSELMLERPGLDPEHNADLRTLQQSSRHMLDLVEDLLGYAQLELDRPQLRVREFDLVGLLLEVESAVRPQLRGRPIDFQLVRPAAAPIRSDSTRVRQIAYNLVANALKFTRSGAIVIALEPAGDDWLLHVRDTGIGIAADKLPLLFTDFSQVHGDGEYGGSGLGLAISRRYARLLGGDITAASAPGEGSTFTVRLPRSTPV